MRIDSLRLRVSGMSEQDASSVGRRVGELLAAANLDPGRNFTSPLQRYRLVARPGEGAMETAERIAREILGNLERGL